MKRSKGPPELLAISKCRVAVLTGVGAHAGPADTLMSVRRCHGFLLSGFANRGAGSGQPVYLSIHSMVKPDDPARTMCFLGHNPGCFRRTVQLAQCSAAESRIILSGPEREGYDGEAI